MGFETYLYINGRVLFLWRKYSSPQPRVLFRPGDFVRAHDGDEACVVYRTTVAEAMRNLELAGLGWQAAIAGYAETRDGAFSEGFFIGDGFTRHPGADKISIVERELESFVQLPSERDLISIGRLWATEWQDDDTAELTVLESLSYDGDLPSPSDAAWSTMQAARARDIPDPFAAARAAESFARLDRFAPLLAWPLMACVFLRHLPDDAILELDLTEDARSADGELTWAAASQYAEDYWSSAVEWSASHARTLERMFAVLANGEAGAGAEFWFARAADLLGRLKSMRETADVTTKARGDALEDLVEALFRTEAPELQVLEKNLRTRQEEIDLVLTNGIKDPFWTSLSSPLVLVECKNYGEPVGVPPLRILESKMSDRGALCRVGIFVSMSGFTQTFLERLRTIQSADQIVFALDGEDLASMISSKQRLTEWLRNRGLQRSLTGRA